MPDTIRRATIAATVLVALMTTASRAGAWGPVASQGSPAETSAPTAAPAEREFAPAGDAVTPPVEPVPQPAPPPAPLPSVAPTRVRPPVAQVEPSDDSSPIYGDQGQLVFGAGFRMSMSTASVSYAGQESSQTIVELLPTLGYFVRKNVLLGALLGIRYLSVGSSSASEVAFGPLAAFNIPIGPMASFQPKVVLTYAYTEGGSNWVSRVPLTLAADFLIHAAPHFFVGIGPFFSVTLHSEIKGGTGDGPSTQIFGVAADIGGWL